MPSLLGRGLRYGSTLPSRLFSAGMRRLLGTVTGVATREPVAALTFDDGPHPEYTPRLLDVLERHGARATFFMVGKAAAQHPDIVGRVAAGGHAIGNHSWDHPSLPLLGRRGRRDQIRACADALAPHERRLFRPPFGHQVAASRLDAWRLGYEVVAWSFHVEDWLDHGVESMVDGLASRLGPGRIALMHDNLFGVAAQRYADRTATIAAVDATLHRLTGALRFVTVPELLTCGRPLRKHWHKEADAAWRNRPTVAM